MAPHAVVADELDISVVKPIVRQGLPGSSISAERNVLASVFAASGEASTVAVRRLGEFCPSAADVSASTGPAIGFGAISGCIVPTELALEKPRLNGGVITHSAAGLATNLRSLGVNDLTILEILRHIDVSVTRGSSIKGSMKRVLRRWAGLKPRFAPVQSVRKGATPKAKAPRTDAVFPWVLRRLMKIPNEFSGMDAH